MSYTSTIIFTGVTVVGIAIVYLLFRAINKK